MRGIIAAIIFTFGFLLCVCAMGTLEFEDMDGIVSEAVLLRETIKSVVGLVLMAAAYFVSGIQHWRDNK